MTTWTTSFLLSLTRSAAQFAQPMDAEDAAQSAALLDIENFQESSKGYIVGTARFMARRASHTLSRRAAILARESRPAHGEAPGGLSMDLHDALDGYPLQHRIALELLIIDGDLEGALVTLDGPTRQAKLRQLQRLRQSLRDRLSAWNPRGENR